VSADRANQRGCGQTGRCPMLLAKRWSSPRQRARQRLNDRHRTSDGPRRTAAKLPRCARDARRLLRTASARVRGEESKCGTGQLEKGRGGDGRTGAASACVVGVESTATRWLCAGGSGGGGRGRVRQTGPMGQREQASVRAAGQTSGACGTEREQGRVCGEKWRRQVDPTGQREG
jgi:hypothetical protein